jgi:hypothetical protein
MVKDVDALMNPTCLRAQKASDRQNLKHSRLERLPRRRLQRLPPPREASAPPPAEAAAAALGPPPCRGRRVPPTPSLDPTSAQGVGAWASSPLRLQDSCSHSPIPKLRNQNPNSKLSHHYLNQPHSQHRMKMKMSANDLKLRGLKKALKQQKADIHHPSLCCNASNLAWLIKQLENNSSTCFLDFYLFVCSLAAVMAATFSWICGICTSCTYCSKRILN